MTETHDPPAPFNLGSWHGSIRLNFLRAPANDFDVYADSYFGCVPSLVEIA